MDTNMSISKAAAILLKGGLIAVPTDTIYGVACLAQDTSAVERLYKIKGRDVNKPIAICVSKVSDFSLWCHVTVPSALLHDVLPGPVTLVFPRKNTLNSALNPKCDLVGLRIPDTPLLINLVEAVGQPLALTSANLSREPSSLSIQEFSSLWPHLDMIIDAGRLHESNADRSGSTVVDLSSVNEAGQCFFKVIRMGSSSDQILNILCKNYGLKQCSPDVNHSILLTNHS